MKFFLALLFSSSFIVTLIAQAPFITTWKTDYSGSSCNSCITIPTHPESTYNYEVDWDNDGVFDTTGITGSVTHDFEEPGTYTIAIRGDFPRIFFNNQGDKEKILSVDQWGRIQWESMNSAFYGCENLNGPMADTPNLSKVTDMAGMFWGAVSFDGHIGDWDVRNVTDMSQLFRGASSFNQDIGDWDVSNVKKMGFMFYEAEEFNQDISDWDVSNLTIMTRMFWLARNFNQDIGDWDVSNVRTMSSTFFGAENFNHDISDWDVSKVTTMVGMFWDARNFNQDIGSWEVYNVTNISLMFSGAENFNHDISDWDVSNVIWMTSMFRGTENFNQDISDWNVSNVTNMESMFRRAGKFNQDIGDWDVSNVITMKGMFAGAEKFDQSVASWELSNLSFGKNMLDSSGLSCENYSSTLIGWANNPKTPNDIDLGAEGMTYSDNAKTAREALISKGWMIFGDSEGSCTVSSDQIRRASIALYPNPTMDVIRLDIDRPMSYRIFDSQGREVRQGSTRGTINVSELPPAVYFVHLVDESGRKVVFDTVIKM